MTKVQKTVLFGGALLMALLITYGVIMYQSSYTTAMTTMRAHVEETRTAQR